MSTKANDILRQVIQLNHQEQERVFWQLVPFVVSRQEERLESEERHHIDSVLLDRSSGPFVPMDEDFVDRVVASGNAFLKRQQ